MATIHHLSQRISNEANEKRQKKKLLLQRYTTQLMLFMEFAIEPEDKPH